MTVIPAVDELTATRLAVPLPMYAQVIGYSEEAFNGINVADPPAVHSNKRLWRKSERDMVEHYLAESQAEIEQVTRYPLRDRWYADEELDYAYPVSTRWTRVIEAGIEATDTTFGLGEAVGYVADPSVVGPIATTVTDEDEIVVYHPGTEVEIYPSSVTIALGFVTIEIPRARLLTEAGYANYGVDYTDTGAPAGMFEQTVDVVRVYNDDTTHATLVWPHGLSTSGCPGCTGTTRDACMVIIDGEIGEIDIMPATYSAGSWGSVSWSCLCHMPSRVRLNYRAGLTTLTNQARDAIIRLAHAKMPHNPCNVEPPNYLWEKDTLIPRALTRERLNCPFGLENGAWAAYKFAKSMAVIRGYTL